MRKTFDRSVLFNDNTPVTIQIIDGDEEVENHEEELSHEEPQPKWMGLKVGEKVQHKTFGKGEVKSVDGGYIVVAFALKESRFLYPWIFEKGYLTME